MANILAPGGFSNSRLLKGSAPNYATRDAYIAYNYGTKIAYGDPVFLNSSGNIQLYVKGGTTIHGIFRGCNYLDPSSRRVQWYNSWMAPGGVASTTVVEAKVDIDPDMVFICQVSGGPVTQADVGLNIDILANSSGNPTYAGMSVCALDAATIASTATLPFRIVGLVGEPGFVVGYNPAAANNLVQVVMNTSDITTRTGQS